MTDDIRYYDRRFGRVPILIADDNLGANRVRLERLCHSIIASDLARSFSCQVRLDLAEHPETLAIMKRAGFERAFIGYESINPKSLEAVGKGLSCQDMGKYTKAFHRHGIAIHSMWVLGFDDDTVETVKNTIRFCIRQRIETTQFLILVPAPGSQLYERFKREDRIFNWDWSKYDGHHITFYPKRITAHQLQVAVMLDAMPRLYRLGQTVKIFSFNNLRISKGVFRLKSWHPVRDLKANFFTLCARLWGKGASRKMRKSIGDYLKQIPFASKASG